MPLFSCEPIIVYDLPEPIKRKTDREGESENDSVSHVCVDVLLLYTLTCLAVGEDACIIALKCIIQYITSHAIENRLL